MSDTKNNGRELRPREIPVLGQIVKLTHYRDSGGSVRARFLIQNLARVTPYGVYGLMQNAGVSAGVDQYTSAFAAQSIRHSWNTMGQATHPNVTNCRSRQQQSSPGGGLEDTKERHGQNRQCAATQPRPRIRLIDAASEVRSRENVTSALEAFNVKAEHALIAQWTGAPVDEVPERGNKRCGRSRQCGAGRVGARHMLGNRCML